MNKDTVFPGTIQMLQQGEIRLKGQFLLGSNHTFLADVTLDGESMTAVYKPQRGQQPLWDFAADTLASREVAAHRVSECLGWGIVPVTVLRQGPFGPGSLQEYIDHDPRRHYFTFPSAERQRLRPVALLDMLLNNADRKGSHVLLQTGTQKIFAIDHGLCFHVDDKLRTVIWDFAGKPIPPELLADVTCLRGALQGSLAEALTALLTTEETAALLGRTERILANPVYPLPPQDRRAIPYPPI